jgi:tetratricopeptide (TPR) repeat protein
LLKNRNAPQLRLLKNVVERLPPSIAFRLRGTKSNRDAIGATVTVETELFFGLGRRSQNGAGGVGVSFAAQQGVFSVLRPGRVKRAGESDHPLAERLFDRHRDLTLPTALLVDAHGFIAKVYQGPLNPESVEHDFRHIPQTAADRLASALPFPGAAGTYEYGRNNLSLGSVFFAHGYLEQAEKQFQLALRDDPSSAEAHYGLGSVYLQQKKTDQARASFERALQLNASYPGTRPNAWNNLGLLATREGRTGDAIGDFQEALRNSPDHLIALENLGNAYRQEKRWGEARAALERALTGKPHDPEANYSLAMVYAQTGDTARAYDYLQKALLERPDYPEALNNLGVLYLRTGRRDAAVAQFEKSILVAPDFDQAYLNLARVYALEGSTEKARAVLAGLLKQHPGHAQARKALDELR